MEMEGSRGMNYRLDQQEDHISYDKEFVRLNKPLEVLKDDDFASVLRVFV